MKNDHEVIMCTMCLCLIGICMQCQQFVNFFFFHLFFPENSSFDLYIGTHIFMLFFGFEPAEDVVFSSAFDRCVHILNLKPQSIHMGQCLPLIKKKKKKRNPKLPIRSFCYRNRIRKFRKKTTTTKLMKRKRPELFPFSNYQIIEKKWSTR